MDVPSFARQPNPSSFTSYNGFPLEDRALCLVENKLQRRHISRSTTQMSNDSQPSETQQEQT